MVKTHKLDDFKASISTQGSDKHIHIPRKMYPDLKKKELLNKKFTIKISLVEIEN